MPRLLFLRRSLGHFVKNSRNTIVQSVLKRPLISALHSFFILKGLKIWSQHNFKLNKFDIHQPLYCLHLGNFLGGGFMELKIAIKFQKILEDKVRHFSLDHKHEIKKSDTWYKWSSNYIVFSNLSINSFMKLLTIFVLLLLLYIFLYLPNSLWILYIVGQ